MIFLYLKGDQPAYISVYTSDEIKVHIVPGHEADQFYEENIGTKVFGVRISMSNNSLHLRTFVQYTMDFCVSLNISNILINLNIGFTFLVFVLAELFACENMKDWRLETDIILTKRKGCTFDSIEFLFILS